MQDAHLDERQAAGQVALCSDVLAGLVWMQRGVVAGIEIWWHLSPHCERRRSGEAVDP